MSKALLPSDYADFLAGLKARILDARTAAVQAVNCELILLYWDMGRGIVEKQQTATWGDAVVEQLAADLRAAFPDMRGFSPRNVWDMRRFYTTLTEPAFLAHAKREMTSRSVSPILRQPVAELNAAGQSDAIAYVRQLAAEIPWGHHLLMLNKLSGSAARLYYLRATARFGWCRNVLLNQIKAGAYERALKEKKTHNFPLALPEHFAEQADEMLKSRYNLEFLGIGRAVNERELEDRLIARLQRFSSNSATASASSAANTGSPWAARSTSSTCSSTTASSGRWWPSTLKIGPFEPEHAGKMDFYLNLLNANERGPDDQPVHRHHPVRREGRRRGRVRAQDKGQSHRRGGIPAPAQPARGIQGQASHGSPAFECAPPIHALARESDSSLMTTRTDHREAVVAALKAFDNRPLAEAAGRLFATLGYQSDRRLP